MLNANEKFVTALVERAKELGWGCTIDTEDSSIEFKQSSPAGEDFCFCAYGDTAEEIVSSIREYAADFDIEEHVKMWLDAKNNGISGVPDVHILVQDAEDIQNMLDKLAGDDRPFGLTGSELTLRDKIETTKAEYIKRYGILDWRFVDEGLPWAIQDYHGSLGSVMAFTQDDWQVCRENGFSVDEVCKLCDVERFCSDISTLAVYFDTMAEDMPEEDAVCAVQDFYKWRGKLLPAALTVYEKGEGK